MMNLTDVQLELWDLNAALVRAWRRAFAGCDNVHVRQESLLHARADALVSPANSFAFMDGGLDLVLSQHFGWQLERNVRDRLLEDYDGELPVGQAVIVATEHPQVPWLISAPTMRVPMRVADTANAYLVFRGVLRAVRQHNAHHLDAPIRSLVCPGLGTGEGQMPPDRCARQMRHAFDVCVRGQLLRKGGLAAAAHNHMELIDYFDE